MPKGKQIPFHPILFAVFAVLTLAIHNEGESPFRDAPVALVASLLLLLVAWLCIHAILKSTDKSAIATTVFLLMFFSFGQFLNGILYLGYLSGQLQAAEAFIETTPALLFWFVLWSALYLGIFLLIHKVTYGMRLTTQFLNITSVALLVIVVVTAFQEYGANQKVFQYIAAWQASVDSSSPATSAPPPKRLPNIYYIVLDGYARGDILQTIYHLDNSAFYSFLTQRGFYLADQSHSNYMQTPLSFAATLNASYLDRVANTVGAQSVSRLPLIAMVDDNRTFQTLHTHGYTIETFSTGSPYTDIRDSDVYRAPPEDLNSFENAMIDTTPLSLLLRFPPFTSQFQFHRDRILYAFDHLAESARSESPVFVFVHILAPHPPFVFQPDGRAVNPDRRYDLYDASQLTSILGESGYVEGYRNQLQFITGKTEIAVDQILAQSTVPPVIILQSDHGPGSMLDWTSAENSNIPERLSILNAYYFPDHDYRALYPSITPVNSFRVLLNRLLGTNYPLLQDKSYFSTTTAPYGFINVDNRLTAAP